MQVFLNWQSSSWEQTCHHQCLELILWMVTSMERLRWGQPFHSISGTRTVTTGQRGGRQFSMVASLNAAAKSDWAHESDVLLAGHQTNIWTAAYKESFLSILRAVWTKLEYCSYFPLWFISFRHLESALTVQQNPRLGQILLTRSVTSGEKSQSREKVWKEDRNCWWGQRERKREDRYK